MSDLINTRHIRSELLYEVTVDPSIPRPTYRDIIEFLDSIDVIAGDSDVFVLTPEQYEKFRGFVEKAMAGG